MDIRYECGIPSITWDINMLHKVNRKMVRFDVDTIEIMAAEQPVRNPEYIETLDDHDDRLIKRIVRFTFQRPMTGRATAQLVETV